MSRPKQQLGAKHPMSRRSCWNVLGVPPYCDRVMLKRAYRDLVKIYHPDKSTSPESKRKNTIRCAAIIDAYKLALALLAAPLPTSAIESPRDSRSNVQGTFMSGFRQAVLFIVTLVTLSLVVGVLLVFGTDWIHSLSPTHPIRVAVELSLFLFFGTVVSMFLAVLDIFVMLLFPRRLLERLHLERFDAKLTWLAVLTLHCVLAFSIEVGPSFRESSFQAHPSWLTSLYSITWRFVAAFTIPLWFLADWLLVNLRFRALGRRAIVPSLDTLENEN